MKFTVKERYDIEDLLRIMELLRSEEGCVWDREQDHHTIRNNFIEESYEAVEAIDRDDPVLLQEELGGRSATGGVPCPDGGGGGPLLLLRCL